MSGCYTGIDALKIGVLALVFWNCGPIYSIYLIGYFDN
jgi:hypothetical protein